MAAKNSHAILLAISALLFAPMAEAQSQHKPDPDYQVLLKAQGECNPEPWKVINWEPRLGVKLSPRAGWLVMDAVSVKRKSQVFNPKGATRTPFKVEYRFHALFKCGEPVSKNVLQPEREEDLISTDTNLKNGMFGLSFDEFSTTLAQSYSEDPEGTNGMRCYSTLDEVIKNPSIIDVERICEGKGEKEKAETRAEIAKAVEKWRVRAYNDCKKKIHFFITAPKNATAYIDGPANIRSSANANASVVGQAPEGAAAQILQKKGNWFQIRSNGLEGWTSNKNLLVSSSLVCKTWSE